MHTPIRTSGRMVYKITWFSRIWKLSDTWHAMYRRELGSFAKSTECPKDVPRTECPSADDPCPREPCPPDDDSLIYHEPSPCPKLPYEPDPRRLIFWRILCIFVALPTIVITSLITYARAKEEWKKPRQPYLDLPYLCRRTKPFPWGDGNHTLFHNPVKNPVPPHGYEVEDPNAVKEPNN